MSEPIATDVEITLDVQPQTVFELTDEWIAYLESAEPPACVAGVDPNIRYMPGDDQTSYA